MRKLGIYISLVFITGFFLAPSAAFGDMITTAQTRTREFIHTAAEPGTFATAEKISNTVGEGIDWAFDQLILLADSVQLGELSKGIVHGVGTGFSDFKVEDYANRGLDAIEDLSKRFWLQDFRRDVLQNQNSQVKIKPYFKIRMDYNSNVFYEPEAPKTRDEVVWVFTPGVSVQVPFGEDNRYRIGAVYEARINEFTKYDEHDDIGQSFGAVANFKLTDDFTANVTEKFVQDSARSGTRSSKRVEYMDQVVTPSVAYHWRNWSLEWEYQNAIRDFESAIYRTFAYANNAFTTRVLRDLTPQVRGLVEYTFSHYDYAADETRVGYYNQFKTGVKGALSERTDVIARLGYQGREYRAHDTQFDIPVFDFLLKHQLTEKAKLDFYFQRSLQESQFTNNRAYDEKLGQFSGSYLFNEKLRGRVGGSLAQHKFQNEAATGALLIKRRDLIGSMFLGLDYAFRPWLVTNLDYRYERSNSNNSNFDYTNNVLSLGMSMPL